MTRKTSRTAELPPVVVEHVEAQRRRLLCAGELLACVAVAYDAGRDFELHDAMLAIRDMINAAVTALDRVELRRAASARREEDD
jgi:hypothetical protein